MTRLGLNYFTSCSICGAMGHEAPQCPVKSLYHSQAVRQVARGSKDPDILREVYGLAPKSTVSHSPEEMK